MAGAIVAIVVVVFLLIVFARTVRIVPQARAGVVERFGRYNRTLTPGLTILVPFVDRLKPLIDLREQVVSFPPQPVITEDNLVVADRHRPVLHGQRRQVRRPTRSPTRCRRSSRSPSRRCET